MRPRPQRSGECTETYGTRATCYYIAHREAPRAKRVCVRVRNAVVSARRRAARVQHAINNNRTNIAHVWQIVDTHSMIWILQELSVWSSSCSLVWAVRSA